MWKSCSSTGEAVFYPSENVPNTRISPTRSAALRGAGEARAVGAPSKLGASDGVSPHRVRANHPPVLSVATMEEVEGLTDRLEGESEDTPHETSNSARGKPNQPQGGKQAQQDNLTEGNSRRRCGSEAVRRARCGKTARRDLCGGG